MAALLDVVDLQARYGLFSVLRGVTLSVGDGELVAMIGANGAGKTTTMRCLSGVVPASRGTITFGGVRLDGRPSHEIVEAGLVQIPEGRQLFPDLSVEQNLRVGANCQRARDHETETLRYVYDLFPRLKERARQPAGTLSGGEQQMVAIGRGLMAKPRMLLLDEPTLGLAPLLVKQLFRTIRDINLSGIAVLLVEQNVVNAVQLSRRTYLLEGGRIQLSDRSERIADNPKVTEMYFGLGSKESIGE